MRALCEPWSQCTDKPNIPSCHNIFVDLRRFRATFTVFEGGSPSLDTVCHEFKEMSNVKLTRETEADPALWNDAVAAFVRKIMVNACAALNARINFTIHFGVTDSGEIRGVLVEDLKLVRNNLS